MIVSLFLSRGCRLKNIVKNGFRDFCSAPHSYSSIPLTLHLDSDKVKRVLSVVNSATSADLETLKLGKQQAMSIVKYREKNGQFNDLDAILKVDGVAESNLRKLCEMIIKRSRRQSADEKRNICLPKIPDELRRNISCVTALKIAATELTWICVQRENLHVTHWRRFKLNEDGKNLPLHILFEMLIASLKEIPSADVYVVEKLPTQLKQPSALSSLLTVTALQATLMTLLEKDFEHRKHHVVYTLKSNVVGNHFNIGIGNERVSCLDLMQTIMKPKEITDGDDISKKVSIPQEMVFNYFLEKRAVKEELGTILLTALAFYDLVVFDK